MRRKCFWLLGAAFEVLFDVLKPLAGGVAVGGEVQKEVGPEVLGGFGFVLVLTGEGDAQEVESFGGEGVCLHGAAGEG